MTNPHAARGRPARWRRLARAAGAAALSATAGCAHLVTERALAPRAAEDAGWTVVNEVPASVYIIHVRLAGGASSLRWTGHGRTVGVRSRPLSTTRWSTGPVLPVIPLFASSSRREVEIDVWVSSEVGPLQLRVRDFALRVPGRAEGVVAAAARVPASDVGALHAADAVVALGRSGSARLIFPVVPGDVESADLSFRIASEDGAWELERTVHFERTSTTFVMTIP